MGILEKLFGKKSIDSLRGIEMDLNKLQKKTGSEIIAIIGTGGRLKGLPLIYTTSEETDLKRFSARLSELITPLANLSNERIVRDIIINFDDSILFFKQFLRNISYFAVFNNKDNVLALKQWIYKNEQLLKELLHEED